MKRLCAVAVVLTITIVALCYLGAEERALSSTAAELERQRAEAVAAVAKLEIEQTELRQKVATDRGKSAKASAQSPISPALTAWLAKGDYSRIPGSMASELRAALGLWDRASSEYAWISKASLEELEPPSPGGKDKVPDKLGALLGITPEQRQGIETALGTARQEFSEWARRRLQREGAQGEQLVKYSVPADPRWADSLTNRLFSAISEQIGPQRSELFSRFCGTWFEIQMGGVGQVTNTLSVLRRRDPSGQAVLYYELTRAGAESSLGESGQLVPENFPPAWRNVFPEGWSEVAQREQLELPAAKSR